MRGKLLFIVLTIFLNSGCSNSNLKEAKEENVRMCHKPTYVPPCPEGQECSEPWIVLQPCFD